MEETTKLTCSISEKEYLKLGEAAAWVGVSENTIYQWQKKGLKAIKIGKNKFYSKKHISEFMEQKKYWD